MNLIVLASIQGPMMTEGTRELLKSYVAGAIKDALEDAGVEADEVRVAIGEPMTVEELQQELRQELALQQELQSEVDDNPSRLESKPLRPSHPIADTPEGKESKK